MTNPVKSKINWVGAIMALAGLLSDPAIVSVIPVAYLPKVLSISGVVVMILRTFFSGPRPVEGNPQV